eukprot:8341895-Lingulodinium_polyedra.AAC.2
MPFPRVLTADQAPEGPANHLQHGLQGSFGTKAFVRNTAEHPLSIGESQEVPGDNLNGIDLLVGNAVPVQARRDESGRVNTKLLAQGTFHGQH